MNLRTVMKCKILNKITNQPFLSMNLGWWRQPTLVVSLWIEEMSEISSSIRILYFVNIKLNSTNFAVFSPPVNFSQAMLQISKISFFWDNTEWMSFRELYNCFDLNLIHCTKSHKWIGKGSCSFHFDLPNELLLESCKELENLSYLINCSPTPIMQQFGENILKDWHKRRTVTRYKTLK